MNSFHPRYSGHQLGASQLCRLMFCIETAAPLFPPPIVEVPIGIRCAHQVLITEKDRSVFRTLSNHRLNVGIVDFLNIFCQ